MKINSKTIAISIKSSTFAYRLKTNGLITNLKLKIMSTLVANNIETTNVVVANNATATAQDGYNAEVTNEVIVLNGDTFYKKNIVVGQKYRYGSHYFTIERFETRGTHLYYIGTLDKQPFANDLHALKVACDCTERRSINRSANDIDNGKAVKVKRTTKETADSIERKYNSVRDLIKSAVAKLPENENIIKALNGLLLEIDLVRNSRVTAILDAEKAKRDARLARIAELEQLQPALQAQASALMIKGELDKALELGKQAQAMRDELNALRAEEANYIDATRIVSTPPADETAETDAQA